MRPVTTCHWPQFRSVAVAGDRQQTEVGLKFQPDGFNGHFGFAWFDLKRQNVLTTDPTAVFLPNQNGEVTSRGFELEAVANPLPGLKLVGAFTTYDLFISKDLNPALIGLAPTATPQSWPRAGSTTPSRRPADRVRPRRRRALYRLVLCRNLNTWWCRRSCSATPPSTTSGRTGVRRSTLSTSPTRSMSRTAPQGRLLLRRSAPGDGEPRHTSGNAPKSMERRPR